MRSIRALLVVIVLALGLPALTACSGESAAPLEIGADTVIIDVRTPEEFAEGHLEGASNIDASDPQFTTLIGALPTDGSYIVYCRSGNRSARAAAAMAEAGFTDVTDLGGLSSAADATGLEIVQP